MEKMSDRYKKALVTVAMGFRTEEDIKNNGLFRFTREDIISLREYVLYLFNKNQSVLALKVKPIGFKSEHMKISSIIELNDFLSNISSLFDSDILCSDNEIWVVSSSVIECWRCRIYLSRVGQDIIEMAYSYDDHILDHIDFKSDVPYISYTFKNGELSVFKKNLDKKRTMESNFIVNDIFRRYLNIFKSVTHDLECLNINGICFDVRVNNGYDFHDFDVSFDDTKKIIDYYMNKMKWCKKKNRFLSKDF